MTDHKFQVSKENLQKLSEDFDVNLNELDDETREALLGLYDPSKYTLFHKICDYAMWFSLLTALIAIIRFHWLTFIIMLFLGLIFLLIGFSNQRSNANKHLRIYRKKLIHRRVAIESLFIDEVWENIIENLNSKKPILAILLNEAKIKPRIRPSKISDDTLIVSGSENCKNSIIFKQLREPGALDPLSKEIEDATGEIFKIYYL